MITLQNAYVQATFDARAHLVSLIHIATGKQAVAVDAQRGGANRFVLFDDQPLYWDAWDVDVYHLGMAQVADRQTTLAG
jgi:alpha-mannosidase